MLARAAGSRNLVPNEAISKNGFNRRTDAASRSASLKRSDCAKAAAKGMWLIP